MSYKAEVANRSWTGHGEGGTRVSVIISGFELTNDYDNRNPQDQATAATVADFINRAIQAYEKQISEG